IRPAWTFTQKLGLKATPSSLGWFAACCGVALGVIDLLCLSKGWTSPNRIALAAYADGGLPLLLTKISALLTAPFFEELALRGFLYRRFREKYCEVTSTALVIVVGALFHWAGITGSIYTAACLILLWILLCAVRERTASIWDCILCHAAYNATVLRNWW